MNKKRWIALGVAAILLIGSIGISSILAFTKMNLAQQVESIVGEETEDLPTKVLEEGSSSQIAVLKVDGTIQDSGDSSSLTNTETYNHQYFMNQLDEIRTNKSIKGVLLKVNSPGGGVVESKQIYEAIRTIQKERKIPFYVSMGSMAASGGYYISAPADKIYADEETMTGSIGVIMQSVNYSKLAEKYGVEFDTIKTGPYKDIMSGTRDMREDERELLQNMIDDSYNRFVKVIVDGRDLSKDEVKKLADGRIYNGTQAKKVGLVDELGYENEALQALKKDNDLQGATVFEYEAQSDWTSYFSVKMDSILSGTPDAEAVKKVLANYNNGPRMMYMYGEE